VPDRRLRRAAVRMNAARIPRRPVLVTSEDVTIGKPHPQCYELAARKLDVKVKECPVFAAAAGILAARAAGARVIVVSEIHISQ
jgi:sugar-phosphatase